MPSLTVCNRAVYTCPVRIKSTISHDYVSWSHSDSPLAGTAADPGLFPTATEGLLQEIGRIMQPVAYHKPQLNVIPLLSFASWSTGKQKNDALAQLEMMAYRAILPVVPLADGRDIEARPVRR